MPKIEPFELYTEDYERWFERNRGLYLSEINLLNSLIQDVVFYKPLEVGIGTGRFAKPLGVTYGIDPSTAMLKIAKRRGLKVARGVAEAVPVKTSSVDFALMVTTICFVEDPIASVREVERILKSEGYFLIGFVDKNSFLGRLYERKKPHSKFYKPATFFSTEEILNLVESNTTLVSVKIAQTIFGLDNKIYPHKEGFGEGAFVGILFQKKLKKV
jgi:SAM-dependent methyltransferase